MSQFASLFRLRVALVTSHPLARRLARGTFWMLMSKGVGQGFSFLASMVTARYLGAAGFGKLGIVLVTVNMFAVLGSAGLGSVTTKYVAQFRESNPERAGRVIGMSSAIAVTAGALVGVGLIAAAPWIAVKVLVAPALVRELRIGAIMLFFVSVNGYQVGALAGFEAFRSTAAANLIRGLGGFPFLVAGAALGGLTGAVIANSLVNALGCIAHAVMLRRECQRNCVRKSYDFRVDEFRMLYRFCVPVLMAGAAYILSSWASNTTLARVSGYSETGIFQAAFQLQTLSLFLAVAVSNVGLPMLAANLGSRGSYLRVLAGNVLFTTGPTLVTAVLVAISAPYFARLYGPQFHGATVVIRVMCACSVLLAANASASLVIYSFNEARAIMLFALLRGTVLVAASLSLAGYGAKGLAWANLITVAAQILVEVPFAIRCVRRALPLVIEPVPVLEIVTSIG
jgi:O-antigen/teichoic acid export membrane protein